MNQSKIKDAFSNVKKDMLVLTEEINNLKKGYNLNEEVKKQIEKIESFNLEGFTKELKEELKAIENLINEFNLTYKEQQKQLEGLKEKVEVKSPKITQDALNELGELINEKMTIELNSLRLEMTNEIANVYDKCFLEIMNLKQELNKTKKKK